MRYALHAGHAASLLGVLRWPVNGAACDAGTDSRSCSTHAGRCWASPASWPRRSCAPSSSGAQCLPPPSVTTCTILDISVKHTFPTEKRIELCARCVMLYFVVVACQGLAIGKTGASACICGSTEPALVVGCRSCPSPLPLTTSRRRIYWRAQVSGSSPLMAHPFSSMQTPFQTAQVHGGRAEEPAGPVLRAQRREPGRPAGLGVPAHALGGGPQMAGLQEVRVGQRGALPSIPIPCPNPTITHCKRSSADTRINNDDKNCIIVLMLSVSEF